MKQQFDSSCIKSVEAFFLQNIKRFFLKVTFNNENFVIYDVEDARTLSSLYTRICQSYSAGKFYNMEIKGKFVTICNDELFDLCQENSQPNRKEEILNKLKELEIEKKKLLQELGEICYSESIK